MNPDYPPPLSFSWQLGPLWLSPLTQGVFIYVSSMIVWDFPLASNTISSEPCTASGTNTYTQSSIALHTGDTETNSIKCHNCKRMCYLFSFVAWSISDATSYSLSDVPDRTDGPFGFMGFVILGQGTVLSLHVSFTEIRQCCAVLLLWVTFHAELRTCFSYCRFTCFSSS